MTSQPLLLANGIPNCLVWGPLLYSNDIAAAVWSHCWAAIVRRTQDESTTDKLVEEIIVGTAPPKTMQLNECGGGALVSVAPGVAVQKNGSGRCDVAIECSGEQVLLCLEFPSTEIASEWLSMLQQAEQSQPTADIAQNHAYLNPSKVGDVRVMLYGKTPKTFVKAWACINASSLFLYAQPPCIDEARLISLSSCKCVQPEESLLLLKTDYKKDGKDNLVIAIQFETTDRARTWTRVLESCTTLPADRRGYTGEEDATREIHTQEITKTTTLRMSDTASLSSPNRALTAPSIPTNIESVRAPERRDALLSASRCESVVTECRELESEVSTLRADILNVQNELRSIHATLAQSGTVIESSPARYLSAETLRSFQSSASAATAANFY